jgi:hypothetical protein
MLSDFANLPILRIYNVDLCAGLLHVVDVDFMVGTTVRMSREGGHREAVGAEQVVTVIGTKIVALPCLDCLIFLT